MDTHKDYTDAGFWQKFNTFARKAGRGLIEKALQLYYAAESPDTPTWEKGMIYGALAYFVAPIDAIPDITPDADLLSHSYSPQLFACFA